jgi:hypothetical protein
VRPLVGLEERKSKRSHRSPVAGSIDPERSWHYDYPPCGYNMNHLSDARVEHWPGQSRHRELYISRQGPAGGIPKAAYVFSRVFLSPIIPRFYFYYSKSTRPAPEHHDGVSSSTFHYINTHGIVSSLPCCAYQKLPIRICKIAPP